MVLRLQCAGESLEVFGKMLTPGDISVHILIQMFWGGSQTFALKKKHTPTPYNFDTGGKVTPI